MKLLPPQYTVGGRIYEAEYSCKAIRVMGQEEYRLTVLDNSETWAVFGVLCLMSIGYPLAMWFYARHRNVKIKIN